jgi:uroporphyrinogen decarboxylase
MMARLVDLVLQSPTYLPMPICAQVGTQLIKASVRDLVTNAALQSQAILALEEMLGLPVLMCAMDLSVEAEAMGCKVIFPEDEIPSVISTRISNQSDADRFEVPALGEGRTGIGLDVVRALKKENPDQIVLGCMIGPFSLLVRLMGATEALELTVSDPALLENLLEKILPFQTEYAKAYQAAGGDGVMIAEPAAGLLSPRAMRRFSSAQIQQLVSEVQKEDFVVILHNCGAKPIHLQPMLETSAQVLHFGAPMHLPAAVSEAGQGRLISGNLDPYAVFVSLTADEVRSATRQLLQPCAGAQNLIPSSGCDLPAHTPLENLREFVEVVRTTSKAML